MKYFVEMAKKSVLDSEGFLNGFIKGAAGSAIILVLISTVAAFH